MGGGGDHSPGAVVVKKLKPIQFALTPGVAKEVTEQGMDISGVAVTQLKDLPEDTISVHVRKADLPQPHVPSELENCASCGEEVWVTLAMPARFKRLCMQCALKMAEVGCGSEQDAEGGETGGA